MTKDKNGSARVIENPRVGGSIPPPGTTFKPLQTSSVRYFKENHMTNYTPTVFPRLGRWMHRFEHQLIAIAIIGMTIVTCVYLSQPVVS